MADPVTLFILVAAGERPDLTRAMAGATRDALGANAVVVVREVTGEPNEPEALAIEHNESADAVAELSWTDARHQQASVKMHIAQDQRWVERSIGFLRLDADAERGRTLGFTIASILPQAPPAPSPSPAVPARAGTPGAPSLVSPSTPSSPVPIEQTPTNASEVTAAPSPPQPPAPARRLNLAVDALAIGAVATAGTPNNGAGGGIAVQWFPYRHLALRVGGGLRAGTIDAAGSPVLPPFEANTLTMFVSGGAAFHPWRTSAAHPFGASLRAEFLFLDESVTHFGQSLGQSTEVKHRRFPGLDVAADVSWRFAPDVELVAGAGIEELFGTAYLDIGGKRVATLTPLGVTGETGLRLDF
jgi:hypothetical protein